MTSEESRQSNTKEMDTDSIIAQLKVGGEDAEDYARRIQKSAEFRLKLKEMVFILSKEGTEDSTQAAFLSDDESDDDMPELLDVSAQSK